ncbi:Hint domain-containing protein [Marivita hallyeonensis]|uniref:Hint domain-containing protein n=1 Tax=Marivita hallyeonensis TaxID=996342 RepID=A0A1M5M7H9_9RHOB|nr:Hint domain-containing protein [Marivita hallyeonensis]SHG73227.1 Hint domain-containing protein [Marivita hallyeonensis]
MALLSFDGNLVAQVNSFNDDGLGGTNIEVDDVADLDGNGNPYYNATDTILIEIDDTDIDANGEFIEAGADGKITVLSIKVNGVELLSSPDYIKFGGGSITEMGDAYFFVEGLKLAFLSPVVGSTFEDATVQNGKLTLNVPEQTGDYDLNESGQVDGGTAEEGNGVFNIYTSNVVCFVKGTLIKTPTGDVPIERLKQGDLVETLDGPPQPIQMIVRQSLDFAHGNDTLKPIEFKPGSLGVGKPNRTLSVSPQHRILITSPEPVAGKGASATLVAAKGLLHHRGVRQKRGCKSVEYFHLVFSKHEVIFSEGVATESFFPGRVAMGTLSPAAKREFFALFPNFAPVSDQQQTPARQLLRAGKAQKTFPRGRTVEAINGPRSAISTVAH